MNLIKFKVDGKIAREFGAIGYDINYDEHTISIWKFNGALNGTFDNISVESDSLKTVITLEGFVEVKPPAPAICMNQAVAPNAAAAPSEEK